MIVRARVVIAAALAAFLLGGFAPSAHALFGRHKSNQPRAMRHAKKNSSPYGYLKPKKLKKANGGWYQSGMSGNMVYGKKKK